jgi:hypothetical protein
VRVRVELLQLAGGSPASRSLGYDRGNSSIVRTYIDRFVDRHASDIERHVLEVGDSRYSQRHPERVERTDVVHLEPVAGATIVCDLTEPNALAGRQFDSIVCTQTLQFTYDPKAMLATLHRALKPGGILLLTGTNICPISRYDMDRWGEYWRFTPLAARRLFEDVFGSEAQVEVVSFGNVLTATLQLAGLAAEELAPRMFDPVDDDYPLVVGVRAQKPQA